jgi:hypothetical protein
MQLRKPNKIRPSHASRGFAGRTAADSGAELVVGREAAVAAAAGAMTGADAALGAVSGAALGNVPGVLAVRLCAKALAADAARAAAWARAVVEAEARGADAVAVGARAIELVLDTDPDTTGMRLVMKVSVSIRPELVDEPGVVTA